MTKPLKKVYIIANLLIVCMLFALSGICFFGGTTFAVIGENISKPYYKGNVNSRNVSLMVNVYWGDEYLDGMLKAFKKYDVKVTFFIGGSWVKNNSDMLNRMIDEGHEIGNHGYSHNDHKGKSYDVNFDEINKTNQLVNKLVGIDLELFAPPSGSYDDTTLEAARKLEMKVIMWSRDTVDWRDKDENIVFKRATNNISGGDLILMHPTAHTLKALPRILQFYQDNNLSEVTVSNNIRQETILK